MERIIDDNKNNVFEPTNNIFNANAKVDYSPEELKIVRENFLKKEDFKLEEDEYIDKETFTVLCKNCHTSPYVQHNNFIVKCRCQCKQAIIDAKRKEEKEFLEKQRKMERLKQLQRASLLGDRYKDASFENLDLNRPEDFLTAVKRCKTYCEKWEEIKRLGQGIYLYGDVGTGKSLLTACIGNCLLNKLVPVLFTNFFEIAKEIKRTWNYNNNETESDYIYRLSEVDLLIIDDIGTEKMLKDGEITWLQEKIYDVINARYINKMPTIFSSNESLTELVEKCGLMKKTVDRIASMSSAKIKLQGSSYRLKEQKNSAIF